MARYFRSRDIFPFIFAGVSVSLMITMGLVWFRLRPVEKISPNRPPLVVIVPRKHHTYHRHHHRPHTTSPPVYLPNEDPSPYQQHYNHFHKLRLLNRKRLKTVIVGPEVWRKANSWLLQLPAPTDFNLDESLNHGLDLVGGREEEEDEGDEVFETKPTHSNDGPFSMFSKHQDLSENPDWHVRGKWQEYHVTEFCRRKGFSASNITLPSNGADKDNFLRRMLYDDHRQVIFCFIPKVGCTNMKMSILIGQRKLSRILLRLLNRRQDLVELKLERALMKYSFLNSNLTDNDRIKRTSKYSKFVIFRHPLDRLVSAYRDKLGAPLIKSMSRYNYFEELKHTILLKYHPNAYQMWKTSDIDQKLYVPFSTFVRWLVDTSESNMNEHFQTQFTITQPCVVRYNFYGDFRKFAKDGLQILNQFTSELSSYRKEGSHKYTMTRSLLHLYYTQLDRQLKGALWKRWSMEFEFFHLLYPSERTLTEKLLGRRPETS